MTILSAADYAEITCVCRVIRITAECDLCGAVVTAVHAPDVTWGFYCRRCCPCRWYRPNGAEQAAMDYNRARLAGRQLERVEGTASLTRSEAARRQWADPKARKKITAAMRRGHAVRRT